MSRSLNEQAAKSTRRDPDRYFIVGGVIPADRRGYLPREADEALYGIAHSGGYAHVLAPRHSGKSSLVARTAERLRVEDRLVAVIDLSQMGSRERGVDSGRWFYSFAFRLVRQLRLRVDLQTWWQEKSNLTNRQRLTELYLDVILEHTQGPITVFIDTPHSFDAMPFADDLLASVNAAHSARGGEPEFSRLNFILVSVSAPRRGNSEAELARFSGSERVELRDFSERNLQPLYPAMRLPRQAAAEALSRIHFWTSGQPQLTMKLARAVARRADEAIEPAKLVDGVVRQLFANPSTSKNDPHIAVIRGTLLEHPDHPQKLLSYYGRVRKGERIRFDAESRIQRALLEQGLLKRDSSEVLQTANRIYAMVFTPRWVNEHLPYNMKLGVLTAAALVAVFVVPIWYSQVFPGDWIERMSNPDAVLADATEAHERMRAWPGHRVHANELLAAMLENRSIQSNELPQVLEYDRLLRELPGAGEHADSLLASYWDRTAARHELAADRDTAILSRLQALQQPSLERRRRAAALIGDDYGNLLTTVRFAYLASQAVLSADAATLTLASSTMVVRYNLRADPPVAGLPWEAQALSVQPIVSRVAVAKKPSAGHFRLLVGLDHDRVDDLVLRLASPSGRSVQLSAVDSGDPGAAELEFDSQKVRGLADLLTESARGSWTLSVADIRPAITGRLQRWELRFASGGTYTSNDAGNLELPDPVEDPNATVVLSPTGRYAVATPSGSDGVAQVWEVEGQQAVASVPLTEADTLVGFVLDERVLIAARTNGIAAWALATGEPSWAPAITEPVIRSALSLNGQFLVAAVGGAKARIGVYDLIEERHIGDVAGGVDHDRIAVANDGRTIAVADADRTVRIWQPGLATPFAELPVDSPVRTLAFNASGDHVAVTTTGGGLTVWPLTETLEPLHLGGRNDGKLVFDPAGEGLLVGNASFGFQWYDATLAPSIAPLIRPQPRAGDYAMQLRVDRGAALSFSRAKNIAQLWQLPIPQPAGGALPQTPMHAALSPDLAWLALEMVPGALGIFALDAGPDEVDELLQTIRYIGHSSAIQQLVFSPDAQLVASAAGDGTLRIWDVESSEPREFFIRDAVSGVRSLAFSPDSRYLASASASGIRIWDTASGSALDEAPLAQRVDALVFASDGTQLFAGSGDGSVTRVTIAEQLRVDRFSLTDAGITALAENAGVLVAADSLGRVFRLGNWAKKQPLVIATLGEACLELKLSADGDSVVCRSAGWLHRLPLTEQSDPMSRVLPAARTYPGVAMAAGDASQVVVLAGNGVPEPLNLAMDATDVSELVGDPAELLRRWRIRLGVSRDPAVVATEPQASADPRADP